MPRTGYIMALLLAAVAWFVAHVGVSVGEAVKAAVAQ
jgi:hypothetical protein